MASTHDVQELDISALLAAQSFIWIGEEYDRESKSSDDVDFRGSTTTLAPSSAPSFGVSQIQPSPSMPWLGTGQTSTGAGVVSTSVCAAQERGLFIICYLLERPSVH